MGVFFSNDESLGSFNTNSSQVHSSGTTPNKRGVDTFELLRPEDRAKAAIIGAFVADFLAASSNKNGRNEREPVSSTHTSKISNPPSRHSGHQSHYGNDAFPFLELISTR